MVATATGATASASLSCNCTLEHGEISKHACSQSTILSPSLSHILKYTEHTLFFNFFLVKVVYYKYSRSLSLSLATAYVCVDLARRL